MSRPGYQSTVCRPPTERQAKVLRFIAEYTRENGVPPTMREIAAAVGIRSTNGVNDHLGLLTRREMVRRPPETTSRTVFVTAKGYQFLGWTRCECGAWKPGLPMEPMFQGW